MEDRLTDVTNNLMAAREAQARIVAEESAKLQHIDHALNSLQGRIIVTDHVPRRQDFENLSLVEAAKKWLQEVGEAKTTKEIADEMLARGLRSKSKNFVPNVYASLRNSKQFVRKNDKWQLKEKKA